MADSKLFKSIGIFRSAKVIFSSTAIISVAIVEGSVEQLPHAHAQDKNSVGSLISQQENDWDKYWRAVEDARIPETQEIFNHLTAITPTNTDLLWDENSRLLVVTWTTWNGYTPNISLVSTRDLWVTVVPELKNFCTNYNPT